MHTTERNTMDTAIGFTTRRAGPSASVFAVTQSSLRTPSFVAFLFVSSLLVAPSVSAHHPERETQPVHPRYDVIGPLGNRLAASYRRLYNRPTYLGGKIAYHIAPSSQEAMAWHRAEHRGLYDGNCPRVEDHYFYPKPWEALQTGQRRSVLPSERTVSPLQDRGPSDSGENEGIGFENSTPLQNSSLDAADAFSTDGEMDGNAPVRVETVPRPIREFLPLGPLNVEPPAN